MLKKVVVIRKSNPDKLGNYKLVTTPFSSFQIVVLVFLKGLQQIYFNVGPRFQTFPSQRKKCFDDFILVVLKQISLQKIKNPNVTS